MDAQNQNNDPLPSTENHHFRQNALKWAAGLALSATIAAGSTHGTGAESQVQESLKAGSAATFVLPEFGQLPALERSYLRQPVAQSGEAKPAKGGSEYARRMYDEKDSTESMVVYRHEGLESLSFARPSLEVNKKILEADSLESLEASVTPFFKSLEMNLYMTKTHPEIKDDIVELSSEDLEDTRGSLLAILNEIAITPREAIKLANVRDLVFAHDIRLKKGSAGGVAYMKSRQPGTIALDTSDGNLTWQADKWNHELGHQVAHGLDEATNGAFSKEFAKLNARGFSYKDGLLMGDAVDIIMQKGQRQKALSEVGISSDYSAESVFEDEAETYRTFWRDQMTPDEKDASYGKLLGAKRVLLMESIDQAVPGFKAYMVGLANTGIYGYEQVAYDMASFEVASKYYKR